MMMIERNCAVYQPFSPTLVKFDISFVELAIDTSTITILVHTWIVSGLSLRVRKEITINQKRPHYNVSDVSYQYVQQPYFTIIPMVSTMLRAFVAPSCLDVAGCTHSPRYFMPNMTLTTPTSSSRPVWKK
jgi:hypothetical protein